MNDTYRLELNFLDEFGKNKRITVRRPVEGLTETEIKPVMQTIVDNDIFEDAGADPYQLVKDARYIRTSVEDVFEVK